MNSKNRISLIIICLIAFSSVQSQTPELWGTTERGGNGGGVIFKTDENGANLQVVHDFTLVPGRYPASPIIQASNQKFYGSTSNGGENSDGLIFEYDLNTNSIIKVIDMDEPITGSSSTIYLYEATDNLIYGCLSGGGSNDDGTLFRFDPNTFEFTKLVDFEAGKTGGTPKKFIEVQNGLIYGVTEWSGTYGYGTIFEYDVFADTLIRKYIFTDTLLGVWPQSLMLASNGLLYGVTEKGGVNDLGIIFSYDFNTNTFSKLYDFNGMSGAKPFRSMTEAPNGKFYGVTIKGGLEDAGILYEFDPITNIYTKKYDFKKTQQKQ